MKTLNRLVTITLLIVLALLAVTLVAGDAAVAQNPTKDGICDGIGATGANCDNAAAAENSVNNIVATVINIFSWIVGVIAVIFVIYGGFRYITSGGDSNKVGAAKNTILYAIIGLVIVALAQVIVIFVLNQVS